MNATIWVVNRKPRAAVSLYKDIGARPRGELSLRHNVRPGGFGWEAKVR